ncbi:MAG: hypothetical protein LCH96_08110 [Actinobacteria bacterium]|nr:hypothetical protein [Actinomycetota bacterium]
MATVNALLDALHDRTLELSAQPAMPSNTEDPGLGRLVGNAIRILALIDPPPDVMTILQAMPTSEPAEEPGNSPITTIGYTLGALADTLNANPETVRNTGHTDRGQLRSQVLATLHQVATVSLAALPTDPGFSSPALIRDLADATQTASYVPRVDLREPIGLLALAQIPGSLDDSVARWAETAIEILQSQTRVTSYAFQRTAVTIAALCSTAAATFAEPTGNLPPESAASVALLRASEAWQRAADWPPEVRLGGRATQLRHRSRDLDQALAIHRLGQPGAPSRNDSMSAALLSAEKVGACHESALIQAVSKRSLWINVATLGPSYLTFNPGARRSDWVPYPRTRAGQTLLDACRQAETALQTALDHLHPPATASATGTPGEKPQWEMVSAPTRSRRPRSAKVLTPPVRGIAR